MQLKTVFFLFLSFFLLSSFANPREESRGAVSGQVLTNDNLPAEAITVYLEDTKYWTVTDQHGRFNLTVPSGEYKLIYYSIFAHKKELQITVVGGKNNIVPDVVILEKQAMLDEVVVTGQFRPQSLHNSVNKIRVINSLEIQKRAATDVFALLRLEPGIRISNDLALHESDVEMMGMRGSSVKILLNGMPLKDNGGRKQSLSQIDVNTIEKIEIVEGPMSIVYGTDALAGVINIITKKGSRKPSLNISILEESVGRNYSPLYGEGLHSEHISSNWSHKSGIYVQGAFSRTQNGGWQGIKEGRERQWAPKNQYVASAETGINKEQLSANYAFTFVNEEISVPNVINPNFPTEERNRMYLVDRYIHALRAVYSPVNNFKLEFESSYQKFGRESHTKVYYTDTKKTKIERLKGGIGYDKTGFDYFFSKLNSTWSFTRNMALMSGVDYEIETVSGNRVQNQHSISNLSLFALMDWKVVEKIHLTGGLRKNLYSNFESPLLLPSIQAKFSLNKQNDIRLSYSHGYRAPKAREMFFSFHDSSHNMDGNPNLKPEYSKCLKASYTWRILHRSNLRLTTTLNGYVNNYSNFIELIPDSDGTGHYTYSNIDQYNTMGANLETVLSMGKFSASGSFMLMGLKSKKEFDVIADGEMKHRYSPEANLMLSYQPIKKANISLFYKYTGKLEQYFYNGDLAKYELGAIDAYNWLDLTGSYTLGKHFTVKGGVKNILDIVTVKDTRAGANPHDGGMKGARPLACGRSFFLGLSYNLN